MKQFTFKPWLMALFIAAISLCAVLPGLHVRASEFSSLEDVSDYRFSREQQKNPMGASMSTKVKIMVSPMQALASAICLRAISRCVCS